MCGASDALLPASKEYLSITLWGVVFATLSFAGSCVIRACGSPVYAMGTQLVGALLNVILDAWFIVWLNMEVRGAAIATVISQGISMLWVAAYFFTPYARIRLCGKYISAPYREAVARILAVGAPPFLMHLTFVIIHGLMNVSVARYGGDLAVSSVGIIMSLDSLLFMPAVAIGEGTQPIVGYNYGAQRFDRVNLTVKWAVAATTVFYILSFSAVYSNAELFVRMFNSSDQALIDLTSRSMYIAYIGIPVMGLSIVTGFTLQGLGRARDGLVLSVIRFGLLMLAPLLILPRFFGLYGVWVTLPISDIFGSAVSFLYLRGVMAEMKQKALLPEPHV
jgi:putative MATE family efflux protein